MSAFLLIHTECTEIMSCQVCSSKKVGNWKTLKGIVNWEKILQCITKISTVVLPLKHKHMEKTFVENELFLNRNVLAPKVRTITA